MTETMSHDTNDNRVCSKEGQDPPSGNFAEARSLKRDLLAALRACGERGNPPRPEDLLERWPGDAAKDLDSASILFEDYLQRRRQSPRSEPDLHLPDSPSKNGSTELLLE